MMMIISSCGWIDTNILLRGSIPVSVGSITCQTRGLSSLLDCDIGLWRVNVIEWGVKPRKP